VVFAVVIVHATDYLNRCTRPPASCDATRELSPGVFRNDSYSKAHDDRAATGRDGFIWEVLEASEPVAEVVLQLQLHRDRVIRRIKARMLSAPADPSFLPNHRQSLLFDVKYPLTSKNAFLSFQPSKAMPYHHHKDAEAIAGSPHLVSVDYTPVIFSFVEYTDRSRRYKQLKLQGRRRYGTSSSPHLGVLAPLSVLYDIYLKTKRKALVSSRHCDICSTMVVAQLPVADWHQRIADPTIADAILDRLVHNAHRLELKGESQRKKRAPLAQSDHLEI